MTYAAGELATVQYFREREELGLYSDGEYVAALTKAGLEVSYDEKGLFGYGLYVGAKK